MNLLPALKQHFGFDQFREGQEACVRHILAGHSSLAIFPTGAGKSLCYQFCATQLSGLTLVVSPLLALIKDQVDFLTGKGIGAASLDSSQTPDQNRMVMQQVKAGQIKILMVSVERFNNEGFRHFLEGLAISLMVVDEAHCISEWGHNFRPDYLKLPDYQQAFAIKQVLLLTATAAPQVKKDMAAKFAIDASHIVQTGFYRANLNLSVISVTQAQKNTALLQALTSEIPSSNGAVKAATTNQDPAIIYVTLQHSAEQLAQFLRQHQVNAQAYHAGLDSQRREQIQHDFMSGKLTTVVATIAFGMGIDKSNIRRVIHYDLPKSIENYSQEIGRAGRDGQASNCITLANLEGLSTLENFVYGDTPETQSIAYLLDLIEQESQQHTWEMQLYALSNETNIRQLPLKTLLVQLELMGVMKPKYAYYAQVRYKLISPMAHILGQFDADRAAFLEQVFSATKFKKVWGEPAFQHWSASAQERANKALNYLDEKGHIALESKQLTQVYDCQHLENKAQIVQDLSEYFQQKEASEIARIATLIRFFEQTSCLNMSLAAYFGDQENQQACGHCSSCQGKSIGKLPAIGPTNLPDTAQVLKDITDLKQQFQEKFAHRNRPLTLDSQCRFLMGITTPYLTQCRAKNLTGFGRYQAYGYAQIKTLLANISPTE